MSKMGASPLYKLCATLIFTDEEHEAEALWFSVKQLHKVLLVERFVMFVFWGLL